MKRYCKKHFPDWKDDEYNCGDLKFLWGISYLGGRTPASFCTLNFASLYYSRIKERYFLDLDLSDCKTLNSFYMILDGIYMGLQNYLISQEIKLIYPLPHEIPFNFDLSADTLEELFYQFYIILKGMGGPLFGSKIIYELSRE